MRWSYDRSLALLRNLEPDVRRLTGPEQAEYAYLRGMSDYRIGYRADARHWLSLARAIEDRSPGVLPADWKTRTNEALGELDQVVYTEGLSALTTSRRENGGESEDSAKQGKESQKKPPNKEDEQASPKAPPKDESPPKKDEP